MSVSESKSKAVYIRATTLHSPVYVKGTVKADSTESASKAGTYIFDLTGTDGDLVIYYARSTAKLVAGDEVVVYGHLILFSNQESTKYEMSVAKNVALGVVSINGTATTFVPGTKDTEEIPDDQKGGKNNPYTVADLNALTSSTVPAGLVYAQGYVTSISAHKTSGYNIRFADTKGGEDTFYIFRGDLKDSASLPYVGDKIQVYGYIKYYSDGSQYQFQFNNNTSTEVSILERADATIKSAASNQHVTITFTPAADSTTNIVSGKNGQNVSFTVVCEDGWELNGTPTEAVTIPGMTVTYNEATGYLVKLDGDMEVYVSVKVSGSETVIKGTEEHPYNVEEAIAETNKLESNVYSANTVYVTGYVVDATYNSKYSNWQINIVDEVGGETKFLCYGIKLSTGITSFSVNDKITICGYLKNQNGNTPEITFNGSTDALITKCEVGDATLRVADGLDSRVTVTITGATGGVFTGKNGGAAEFIVAVDGCEITYVVVGGEVVEEANGKYTVTLMGDMEILVAVHETGTTVPGTEEQPYTVTEAIAAATALDPGAYSVTQVYVTGYVVSAAENTQYHNWAIYIADEVNGTTTFYCMRVEAGSNTITSLMANDKITVCGYLQNYNGTTPEITNKDTTNPQITDYELGKATIQGSSKNADGVTINFTTHTAEGGIVTANNGSGNVSFTVSVNVDGKELDRVKVNDQVIELDAGVYTVTLVGTMEIEVTLKDVGATGAVTWLFNNKTPALTSDSFTDLTSTTFAELIDSTVCPLEFVSGTKAYRGIDHTIKFSSSKVNGNLTLKVNKDVTASQITFNAQKYGSDAAKIKVTVTLADSTVKTLDATDLTADFADYTLDLGAAVNLNGATIKIEATKRLYLKSITVE